MREPVPWRAVRLVSVAVSALAWPATVGMWC